MSDILCVRPAVLSLLLTAVLLPASSAAQSVPAPWTSRDIGAPSLAGSASLSSGVFTVSAGGTDIWGTSDQFHFVFQPMTGDGQIVARVDSLTAPHVWSKAGIMMRASLSAQSAHAFAMVSAKQGAGFQRRISTGGSSTHTAGAAVTAPYWIKLVRQGSVFQAYESATGGSWRLMGSQTIAMPSTIYVGLAVTSHNAGVRATARLSNVVLASSYNQPPTVQLTAPANGATFVAPAIINLAASASDADGAVAAVDFYAGTVHLGGASSSPYTVTWSGVAAGTYRLTAVVRDTAGASTNSAPVDITVTEQPAGLPAPWSSQDVGSPAIAGSATYNSGTFVVKAAGTDIWNASDQFHFAHQLLTGDGEVIARVDSLVNTNGWAKAGVMMRESLTGGSRHAFAMVSVWNGSAFQRRTTTGGLSLHTAGSAVAAPYWVRLVRSGDTFDAYDSADGVNWKLLGRETIVMLPTLYVGLAVTSHDPALATTATFTRVSVADSAANQPPAVSIASPSSGATFTAPATLTVTATAGDADGTVTRVDFYQGSTLIGTDTTSPYSATLTNVAAGSYTFTAVAIDDRGATGTSTAVAVTVNTPTNTPPTVTITTPVSGASFPSPTTVAILASAADGDGTISRVDFYAGSVLIGSDVVSPYAVAWSNALPGTVSLVAVATDNGGAQTSSAAVSVTLTPSRAVFTASTDHATLVTSYRLEVFVAGANPSTAVPVAAVDLGKPAPVNGQITADITNMLLPLAPGSYIATVSAIGTGGTTRSAPSAAFTR